MLRLHFLPLVTIISFAFWPNISKGQIQPDGTIETQVSTSDNINFVIDGGRRSGDNLFHSFSQFSVPSGGSATFTSESGIPTIFSRITGASRSHINGLLRTSFGADLFLINPNGIILGPNANLDIGGSFLATTADSIVFRDGFEFSASNLKSEPILTVSTPIGIQFGPRSASIQIRQDRFQAISQNSSVVFVGGGIFIDNSLIKTNKKIELGSVGEFSFVKLERRQNTLDLDYSGVEKFKDISLTQSTVFGGDILFYGQDISLLQDSFIQAADNIFLRAINSIEVDGESRISGINAAFNTVINADESTTLGVIGTSPDVIISSKKVRIAQRCRPGQALGNGEFVNVGRGGLPPDPTSLRSSPAVWYDIRPLLVQQTTPPVVPSQPPPEPRTDPFIEAKGWGKTSKGLMLVAPERASSTLALAPVKTC